MEIKALHSKEKRKPGNWRLLRLFNLHNFYRNLMYRRSLTGMLAVLLILLMTGPYACIKIDMLKKYGPEKRNTQTSLLYRNL